MESRRPHLQPHAAFSNIGFTQSDRMRNPKRKCVGRLRVYGPAAEAQPLPQAGVGRVIIRVLEPETCTAGGLLLGNAAKSPPIGVVAAVGQGPLLLDGTREPPPVKVGDRVLYDELAHWKVELGDEKLVISRFRGICATWSN
mmetsp:Transcript_14038/g.28731  ORF Transcript_14038/g.28731 Transcript_14038/m.28731 type:complete len:142 (+) Transcript_14038:82-507(+)